MKTIKPYIPVAIGNRMLGVLVATGEYINTSPLVCKWVCPETGNTLARTKSGTVYILKEGPS